MMLLNKSVCGWRLPAALLMAGFALAGHSRALAQPLVDFNFDDLTVGSTVSANRRPNETVWGNGGNWFGGTGANSSLGTGFTSTVSASAASPFSTVEGGNGWLYSDDSTSLGGTYGVGTTFTPVTSNISFQADFRASLPSSGTWNEGFRFIVWGLGTSGENVRAIDLTVSVARQLGYFNTSGSFVTLPGGTLALDTWYRFTYEAELQPNAPPLITSLSMQPFGGTATTWTNISANRFTVTNFAGFGMGPNTINDQLGVVEIDNVVIVPEPQSWVLLTLSAACLPVLRRRLMSRKPDMTSV